MTMRYDYVKHSPHHWSSALSQFKHLGVERIESPVIWGTHEVRKGVRDFTQSSRLRLERYLRAVAKEKLTLDLSLGFFPEQETFPEWTYKFQPRGKISRCLWGKEYDDFYLLELPAIETPGLKNGFLEYLSEVFELLTLYCGPEGPVASIRIDFSAFENDLSLVERGLLPHRLAQRYANIDRLNAAYGTRFQDFSAFKTAPNFRVLVDRRPWLAAFDYKWSCLRQVSQLWHTIQELASTFSLGPYLKSSLGGFILEQGASPWTVWVDPTLIQITRVGISPILLAEKVGASAISTYRLVEYLKEHARKEGIGLRLFSSIGEEDDVELGNVGVVVCGKFLSQTNFRSLLEAVQNGKRLFFPFGAPHLDENLENLNWGGRFLPRQHTATLERFLFLKVGEGEVWVPSHTWEYGNVWEPLQRAVNELLHKANA